MARSDVSSLLLLTYDRDFGDLIFHHGLPAPAAVLYTRLNRADPEDIATRLLTLLEAGVPKRHIVTITKDGERMRPFPPGAFNA